MEPYLFTVINEFLFAHGVRLVCRENEWRFHTFKDIHDTLTYGGGHYAYESYADALSHALRLAATLPNRFELKLMEYVSDHEKVES